MITLIASTKGGAGKSTIATNLATAHALAGADVLLVDVDKQATARKWHSRRPEDVPTVNIAQGSGNVTKALRDYTRRYAQVVVDAGGAATPELASAAAVANLVVVPVRPSIADIDAFHDLLAVLETAQGFNPGMRVVAVVNAAATNWRVREASDALAFLESEGIPVAGVLRERKLFRDCMLAGQGVLEYPGMPAAAEFRQVFDALK